jgi:hypothetical protein
MFCLTTLALLDVLFGAISFNVNISYIAGQGSNPGPPKTSTFSIPWDLVSRRL